MAAGLAVPHGARTDLESAARAVRGAAVLVVVLAVTAMLMPGQETDYAGPVAAWFGLPLVLTLGCLAIARVENHPYSPWASPSGQRWLDSLPAPVRGADRDLLAAVAVRGVGAVEDPDLRAALLSGARTAGLTRRTGGRAARRAAPSGRPSVLRYPVVRPGTHRPDRRGAAARGEEWLTPPRATTVRRPSADVHPAPGPGVAGTTGGVTRAVARQLIFRVGMTGNAGYASPATKSATDFLRPV